MLTLEFLDVNCQPITLASLGENFLEVIGVDIAAASKPFRVGIHPKESKAGNAYYDYNQNGIPFKDGLLTHLRLEGAIIPFGKNEISQKGHEMRKGHTEIVVNGFIYSVKAYISKSKNPFYVSLVAHKKPNSNGLTKAQMAPKGGSIL